MKFPMDHKIKRPFVYTSAAATCVADTIKRAQRRLAKLEELKKHFNNVQPIKREASK